CLSLDYAHPTNNSLYLHDALPISPSDNLLAPFANSFAPSLSLLMSGDFSSNVLNNNPVPAFTSFAPAAKSFMSDDFLFKLSKISPVPAFNSFAPDANFLISGAFSFKLLN